MVEGRASDPAVRPAARVRVVDDPAGHTVVEVARWAGHSPAVRLGTYAHLFDTVSDRIDPDLAIREARYGVRADERRAAG